MLHHLAHKVWDDAMEAGALVAEALLASTEGTEVFSSFGHHVVTELQKQNEHRQVSCYEQKVQLLVSKTDKIIAF